MYQGVATLKSLIEEHARLDISDFLSSLLSIFHAMFKQKIPPCSFINLFSKKAGKVGFFSNPACLLFIPVCSPIRDFRVETRVIIKLEVEPH